MTKTINFKDIPGAKQYANSQNTTPETVLDYAKNKLSSVVIIGTDKESGEAYFASSSDDYTEVNFMLDLAKKKLFEVISNDDT